MGITIYHNPRCSKSRQTLALIEESGATPRVIEYLKDPPAAVQIKKLIKMLGIEPHDLLRTKEAEYRQAGLSKSSSEKQIVDAIAEYPKLLERPIVVNGGKAAIGRPPETVLDIL